MWKYSLMRHILFDLECTQLYIMAQINSKERTFADELYQRLNSDKSDGSLIPRHLQVSGESRKI